ncbi:MAG: DUF4338 domain-containing protein [Candidatus Riflebacteria bacterium]|nr:DUF4338 domain-containing protein [Candidatus Riflebacteria bacterium]
MIVSNSRFLIPEFVRVSNLASHVLSLCAKRLTQDWGNRYCYKPLLIETFVEHEKFEGTVYKAANWLHVGTTVGRGRQDREKKFPVCKKDIYLFPLTSDWRKILHDCPSQPETAPIIEKIPEDWAEEEFGNSTLGDKRLDQRLLKIARSFYSNPSAQVPEACKSAAETKAAYRFFENDSVEFEKILAPHISATIKRCPEHSIVLVPQDTTSLNYTAHPETEDIGPIGASRQTIIGLLMHDTMAFSTEGEREHANLRGLDQNKLGTKAPKTKASD